MNSMFAVALAVPAWSALPFALLLLGIAVLPMVAHDWWHKNRNKAIVMARLHRSSTRVNPRCAEGVGMCWRAVPVSVLATVLCWARWAIMVCSDG